MRTALRTSTNREDRPPDVIVATDVEPGMDARGTGRLSAVGGRRSAA